MGTKYTFKCKRCGYNARVSGGKDFGMKAVTDTFTCGSCKNVVDVCVGEYGNIYTREEVLLQKKEPGTGLNFFTCPKCGSGADLTEWDKNRKPCPRCNGRMENDINGLVMEWD